MLQQCRKADVITLADENLIWATNVLGSSNPKQLVHTILYMFGVHFALHASVEHRSLRVGPSSQLELGLDRNGHYLEYSEDVSETHQGGINHHNVGCKVVKAYADVPKPDKCIVNLFKSYMARRPIHINLDDFYLHPLANPKGKTWYASQPIGRNILSHVVSKLAKQAGLKGNFSNHSLCATAASCLYNANVDEQLISEVTGHRSNAVRGYKCTSNDQLKSVSNILYGDVPESNVPSLGNIANKTLVATVKDEDESECKKPKIDYDVLGNGNPLPFNVNVTVNINK